MDGNRAYIQETAVGSLIARETSSPTADGEGVDEKPTS
jgi:hypothetical protein